jgi:hypothetical protein
MEIMVTGKDNSTPDVVTLERTSVHLRNRPTASLRPHPLYIHVCGAISPVKVAALSRHPALLDESLVVTVNGTILDGHVRWQAARLAQRPVLSCLEHDVTEHEALVILLTRHHESSGLNAFCRISLALELEPYIKARVADNHGEASSNLTDNRSLDVRAEIARAAGVSTGNVTKVKQVIETAIPEVRDALRQGHVRIHRAWQWRTLSRTNQRKALWEHLNGKGIKKRIQHLIRMHTAPAASNREPDVAPGVLDGLATYRPTDLAVAVVDVPGRAVTLTRTCYEELLMQRPNGSR